MNYNLQWQAVRKALSYTGSVNESEIMHAAECQSAKNLIHSLIRDRKIRKNDDGTFSHYAPTKVLMKNAKESIRESIFYKFDKPKTE